VKKRIILIGSILLCFALLNGCKKEEPNNVGERDIAGDEIKIGVTFESYVIERWQRDRDIFVSTANELGAQVNVQTASGSLEKQIEQIKYFIEKDMDVIVIIAADSDNLHEAVQLAHDKGIKVIAYDRLIMNANVDLYVSFDSEKVGEFMAETMVENTPDDGELVIVLGPKTDYNVKLLEKGIHSVLSKTNHQVIYQNYADGWLAEEAFTAVNETLEKRKKFDGLICGNDDLASHGIRALAEHRLAGSVSVVGQDADLIACQRIIEEIQDMTVYKPIEKLATRAAEYAVMLAKGEEIPITDTIHDETYDVPYVRLEPIAVTKENIDEVIIEGGFHLKEEVYLNVEPQE
jgi:D-xylose transport system substrate-binding protein